MKQDFTTKYAVLDFDPSGQIQTRVWNRVMARQSPSFKRLAWLGVAGALLFAAGFGMSRLTAPKSALPTYRENVEYSWTCRLQQGENHPVDCRCVKEVAVYEPGRTEAVFSGRTDSQKKSCRQQNGPAALSFYDTCLTC